MTILFTAILSTSHYLLYYLTPAIAPRMLTTFDEDLNPLQVTVRVGQVCSNSHGALATFGPQTPQHLNCSCEAYIFLFVRLAECPILGDSLCRNE
jgi:hypothetical protein